tara:strand:+ start:1657 stop:1914 length:258 start_codon:yes stop_codon:yes gene_type:complete
MLDCKVCGATTYTTYICSECNIIKDCCNLYGRDVVVEVLKAVLIRDDKQRQFKIDKANTEADNDDNTYIKKEERKSERLKDKTTK